jgi:spore coat protein U-like protein
MRLVRVILIVLAALGLSATAHAACQVSASTAFAFSPSSSYDVRQGSVSQSSSSAGFTCSGSLISVVATNSAVATVTSLNSFRLKGSSGDVIPYTASADANGTYAFNRTSSIEYMDSSLLSLLGILSAGTFAPKLYAMPTAGANVSAGTYTDTLTVQWSWQICHGIGIGGICVFSESGTGTALITVTLVVGKDCRISAPALSFGSAPLVSQFTEVNQAVAVDCTKDATYSVAFTSGSSGVSRPWRAMTDGAGHILQYNLYLPDGTTIWDQTNPQPGTSVGTGALVPAQMQSYRARINPAQATPPAGRYTDTVSVIVSF